MWRRLLTPLAPTTPVEVLLARYRDYLLVERGPGRPRPLTLNVRLVRPFLVEPGAAEGAARPGPV